MNTPDKQLVEEKAQLKSSEGGVPRETDTEIDLEERFPETEKLLDACVVQPSSDNSVMVAFDTNALLLPYKFSKDDLSALRELFRKFADENRLFVPARCIREFINLRDRKLADLVQALNNKKSQLIAADGNLSPLIKDVEGYQELEKAASEMNNARNAYLKVYEKIIDRIRQWRGNDPVTSVYREVFSNSRIVEHGCSKEEVEKEWQERLINKIPPGYKDKGKVDQGVGDFIIWKTLLRLGRDKNRDLVFVTGEAKADWFVRAGEPIYPRPELIDEYRRSSSGRNIRLSTLHELLREMKVPDSVVEEVQRVEQEANTAIRAASEISQDATPMGWFVPCDQPARQPPRPLFVDQSWVPSPLPEKKD